MNQIRLFFQNLSARLRVSLSRFMTGRHGFDELGLSCLTLGVVLSLIGSLFGSSLFTLLGFAMTVYTLYRILSKDHAKRTEENRKYMDRSAKIRSDTKAFFLRMKMRKDYKYFRCPGCHSLLRLHRGQGEVKVVCPKCHTEITKKA